ncbi:PCYOX1L isoform 4, partial [Pan troglodytes]
MARAAPLLAALTALLAAAAAGGDAPPGKIGAGRTRGGWGWDWGLCCGPFSPAALWTSGADRRVREGNHGWPLGHHLSQQAALR